MLNLRELALASNLAFRTKSITVPEWDNAKVILREPSGEAWARVRDFIAPTVTEDEEPVKLTETQAFIRNKEADAILFVDVLLDQDGKRVFSDDDVGVVAEIYGQVHRRLLGVAMSLSIDQDQAEKK
ncbi:MULTISPECIES: phage tail assembly chaperone [Pseudomonadati]|uniref:phage tail assembly chaperone n=1 Tax=Pseudomonadati TaxID=3379134 RepID=UPI003397AE9A